MNIPFERQQLFDATMTAESYANVFLDYLLSSKRHRDVQVNLHQTVLRFISYHMQRAFVLLRTQSFSLIVKPFYYSVMQSHMAVQLFPLLSLQLH